MANEFTSPSEITEFYVNELYEKLPDGEKEILSGYKARLAGLTGEHDLKRALSCAKWSVELAGDESGNLVVELADEFVESLKALRDIAYGVAFWNVSDTGTTPEFNVQTAWVVNSVALASKLAEEKGWPYTKWEEQLDRMCEI